MLTKEVLVQAPAKINLFLWISSKGEDGFHPITSVMQTISLFDEIQIQVSPGSEISMEIQGADLPVNGENLAYRAAQKFYGELRTRRDVKIILKKRISVAGGLGGGSSDAAAVLVGLNELHDGPISSDKLQELGVLLGSDVPFFIQGGTALCLGRGEMIRPLPAFDSYFVLVSPHFSISTSWAYREWDAKGRGTAIESQKFEGRRWLKHLGQNDFESVVFTEFPKLKNWKERLVQLGADGAGVSGSGPGIYGKFSTLDLAERAAAELPTFDARIDVVQSIPQGVRVCTPDLSLSR